MGEILPVFDAQNQLRKDSTKACRATRKKARQIALCILPLFYVLCLAYIGLLRLRNHRTTFNTDIDKPNGQIHDYSELSLIGSQGTNRKLQSTGIRKFARNCTPPSIDEFPTDVFTNEERLHGGIILHIFVSSYIFYMLAIVCDDYFVPSMEGISEGLHIPTDVAGATFMAAGTSAPELFTSVIGAFITEGDIGTGTIVGSAVFNILAVVACCGLLTSHAVPIDWWPLSRDCFAYTITVIALIVVIKDGFVHWYEATGLLILFLTYTVMMYFNSSLEQWAIEKVNEISVMVSSGADSYENSEDEEETTALVKVNQEQNGRQQHRKSLVDEIITEESIKETNLDNNQFVTIAAANGCDKDKQQSSIITLTEIRTRKKSVRCYRSDYEDNEDIWSIPTAGWCSIIRWALMWPAHLLFYITIPDCRKTQWKGYYLVTFSTAVVYIGVLSYLAAWMVTIIGYTLSIPDTVMGLTFLAAGTSVPEAISSVIICRQGLGNMAISNCVGSNIFDILFCLGLPWLIKTLLTAPAMSIVEINSKGLHYSAIALLTTVLFMYIAIVATKFHLDRKVGFACLAMYSMFLLFSSLFELNVFEVVNLPTCISELDFIV